MGVILIFYLKRVNRKFQLDLANNYEISEND